jgi:hypothetical protein
MALIKKYSNVLSSSSTEHHLPLQTELYIYGFDIPLVVPTCKTIGQIKCFNFGNGTLGISKISENFHFNKGLKKRYTIKYVRE